MRYRVEIREEYQGPEDSINYESAYEQIFVDLDVKKVVRFLNELPKPRKPKGKEVTE